VDLACDLKVHLGATSNSVEGIFENVEKPLLKTWLSFPVKPCRLASLQLTRIIHDGSSSRTHPSPILWGRVREGGRDRRVEPAREGGILEQDVDRLSGEPACLDAGPIASRLVAAANPRLQQKRS